MKNLTSNYNLVIDTTNNYCILGITDKDNNLIDQLVVKTNNNLTELVTNLIHDLLSKNNIDYCSLNSIYTVIGPGSFTGVKVGTSITKTICSVYPKINVYWMDSISIIANFDGLGCLDAKSKLYYVIGYQDNKVVIPLQYVNVEQLDELKTKFVSIHCFENLTIDQYCNNLFSNLDKFHYLNDYHLLLPAYIKPALYNAPISKKESIKND